MVREFMPWAESVRTDATAELMARLEIESGVRIRSLDDAHRYMERQRALLTVERPRERSREAKRLVLLLFLALSFGNYYGLSIAAEVMTVHKVVYFAPGPYAPGKMIRI